MTRRQKALLSALFTALLAFLLQRLQAAVEPTQTTETTIEAGNAAATSTHEQSEPEVSTSSTNALVVQVVDGDTIKVIIDGTSTTDTIRFLGINTPESVDPRRPVECFGKEASAKLKSLLDGQRVLLVEDVLADNRDKYNRLLRNVFTADGLDVNAYMVREGYAQAYVSFPQDPTRKKEIRALEAEAKEEGRGLWNFSTCNGKK